MTLQNRISKLEAKITPTSRPLTWVDLVKIAEGEDLGFPINPQDPLLEFFKDEMKASANKWNRKAEN